ncbi:ferredoxin [Nocardia sp. CA-135953]|uniref:ferredoxin n=1 Tax=Nocardia sp. CA-135953 TaxID=3239978 RepID=UPI003D9929FC
MKTCRSCCEVAGGIASHGNRSRPRSTPPTRGGWGIASRPVRALAAAPAAYHPDAEVVQIPRGAEGKPTMRVTVDLDVCDGHGQCVFAAPGIFQFDEAGDLLYEPNPDDVDRAEIELAARLCPVQAIAYDG